MNSRTNIILQDDFLITDNKYKIPGTSFTYWCYSEDHASGSFLLPKYRFSKFSNYGVVDELV